MVNAKNLNRKDFQEIVLTPLEDLGLRSQTLQSLREKNIFIVGHLLCLTESELLNYEQVGPAFLSQFKRKLEDYGLVPEMLYNFSIKLGFDWGKESFRIETVAESQQDFAKRLDEGILDEMFPTQGKHDFWLNGFLSEQSKEGLSADFILAAGNDTALLNEVFNLAVADPQLDRKAFLDAASDNVSPKVRRQIQDVISKRLAQLRQP